MQLFGGKFLGGKPNQVDAGHRFSSHRVNIADRIGSRNLPIEKRVRHGRRDKIGGRDDRNFIRQFIDTCIIARVETNQEIGIVILGKRLQQFTEPDRVDFCRSSTRLGKTL